MGADPEFVKTRAPTLYGIIVFKLVKGALFLGLALVLFCLSDNNLSEEWKQFLALPVIANIFTSSGSIQPTNSSRPGRLRSRTSTQSGMLWAAAGTLCLQLVLAGRGHRHELPRKLGRLDGHRRIGLLCPDRNL